MFQQFDLLRPLMKGTAMSDKPTITITKNGPYVVKGNVPLSQDAIVESEDGTHLQYNHVCNYETKEEYALCRCGHSKNMPFCDGSHAHVDWDGTETASRKPYMERVREFDGPELELLDDNRCAFARLCHRRGVDVWNLTEGATDEDAKQQAVAGAWHCPTGRLESHDRETGKNYEQEFAPSIIALEDPQRGCSGPYFVRGGIELIGQDGFVYENRNRYALCRCGESQNKPFCDAMHVNAEFDDGSEALQGQWGARDESFIELPDVD